MHDPIVTRVLEEAGQPLSRQLRAFFEPRFEMDLGAVRLHRSSAASALNAALDSFACTIGDRIAFASAARDSGPAQLAVLAHELAHVVQKRKRVSYGSRAASNGVYEAEADAAVRRIFSGGDAPALTPDPSGAIRRWGKEGHYYTVYYVALAAGLSNRRAGRYAFLAQLPDEVIELDAAQQGFRVIRNLGLFRTDLAQARMIQRGLHCLNGQDAHGETYERKLILTFVDPDSFRFGLALHAFGDSFAHRGGTGTNMFNHLHGHAGAKPLEGHDHDDSAIDEALGHAVDFIHRRQDIYVEYGVELYEILCERFPQLPRRQSLGALRETLEKFCGSTPSQQIQEIKSAAKLKLKEAIYGHESNLNDKPIDWASYKAKHTGADKIPAGILLDHAKEAAKGWDRGEPGDAVASSAPVLQRPGSDRAVQPSKSALKANAPTTAQMETRLPPDRTRAIPAETASSDPKMVLSKDDYSIKGTLAGDAKAFVRAEMPENGSIEVTDIFSGDQPSGSGSKLLAETLKGHACLPTKSLTFKGIINEKTLAAQRAGLPPEQTLLGRLGQKALKALGLEPKRFEYVSVGDKLHIVIYIK